VRIPERAEQHERGSYIRLHKVPAHAILEERAGSDVKYCKLPYQAPSRPLLTYCSPGIW
jgi:hypothetical protein